MDSVKLSKNICRICLKHNVIFNWNDDIFEFSGTSYKDCYYKYTKLKETDLDCYPTNLCEVCGNELKNAHMLFEKAVKSFDILQALLKTKQLNSKCSDMGICNSLPTMKCEVKVFDDVGSTMDDKSVIGTENEIRTSPVYNSEIISKAENPISDCNESMKDVDIEPAHFIDIQNFKSFAYIKLSKSSSTNKTRNKRKKYGSKSATLLEQELHRARDIKLPKSTTSKETGTKSKKGQPLRETTPEQQLDMISVSKSISGSCETKSPLSRKRTKKRRIFLMCAYCSLKVEGARRLEEHEATHSDDRKRTQVCALCGVKFYTKLALTEHIKIHDENREKNHKCEFCEKAFFNKGGLNVHRRIHLGLMVKCQICSKEFFRQVDLDKHLLKHSASPQQKNVGKYKFSSLQHISNSHPTQERYVKKYTAQCQYCNKSVLTHKLKEHIAAHLDQPQVKCKICDKNFFARSKCTQHLKQVHHKNLSEYEKCIHYYVDRHKRMTSLMMKQQFSVQPLAE